MVVCNDIIRISSKGAINKFIIVFVRNYQSQIIEYGNMLECRQF